MMSDIVDDDPTTRQKQHPTCVLRFLEMAFCGVDGLNVVMEVLEFR